MNSYWLKRAAVLGAVLAAALVLVAVGLTTAAAQEPDETVAEVAASRPQPTDTMITILSPGDNLVGWIEGTTPVADLFEAVPEIETVWAWDVLRRQWSAASRRVPSELHTLWTLKPGMGLLVQVGGDEAVEWRRSAYPARGLVELQPGHNLVAWSGRDRSTIDYLALGIGASLVDARVRDTERSEYRVYDPANSESAEGLQAVDRGDAVWVNVNRTVNWLQPTGILPEAMFPGLPGPGSRSLEHSVHNNLPKVVDFFASTYGIEADHSQFAVYVPNDAVSLYSALGIERDESTEWMRQRVERGTHWAGQYGIVISAVSDWPGLWATLVHEYFHVLQSQLSNRQGRVPWWLLEGSAEWMRARAALAGLDISPTDFWADGGAHGDDILLRASTHAPALADGLDKAVYTLGKAALKRLARATGEDAIIEFWRRLASMDEADTSGDVTLRNWRDVFADVFRITSDRFYQEFNEWRERVAPTVVISGVVTGVTESMQSRLADLGTELFVAAELRDTGVRPAAVVGLDGTFAVPVPANVGLIQLTVWLDLGCFVYHPADIAVTDSDVLGVVFRVPENPCG